jgi:arylsulfatase A-like enzyme
MNNQGRTLDSIRNWSHLDRKPNIIYILSDQHRGQAMSHAGDPNVRTPNMDRMAAEGVSFERAYSNCPVCTPSRGTIFSGRHAHCGPVPDFFAAYPQAAPSTATWLRQHGYHTSYIGKWHCGVVHNQKSQQVRQNPGDYPGAPVRTPENRRAGFQDWAGFEVVNSPFKTYVYRDHDEDPTRLPGFQTDVLTDEAIRQLNAYDREDPLYMVLSVEPPHFPCTAPEEFKRFDPAALQTRPNFAKLNPMFESCFPKIDEATLRQMLANYYAMVENLDMNMGRLLDAVARLPRFSDDTLVVYISDHGDYVGSHGINTEKINHHEESLRIPAIFHCPQRIPAQGMVDGLFGLVDLQATVCGLAGVPVPKWNDGFDWSSRLRGEALAGPVDMLVEMSGAPRWTPRFINWRGFVSERWKYAFYEDGREFLHDLQDDPYEMRNLATEEPAMAVRCKARLLELLRETREPFFDVIIEHGVTPEKTHYIRDDAAQIADMRKLGGLDLTSGPLPMA